MNAILMFMVVWWGLAIWLGPAVGYVLLAIGYRAWRRLRETPAERRLRTLAPLSNGRRIRR
jgi:hypothetical protein